LQNVFLFPNKFKTHLQAIKSNHLYQNVIKNIRKETKRQKELINEELRTIFAPTVIFQKVETKKESKRFSITNKVITSKEIVATLQRK
jgi:hypothetical protein